MKSLQQSTTPSVAPRNSRPSTAPSTARSAQSNEAAQAQMKAAPCPESSEAPREAQPWELDTGATAQPWWQAAKEAPEANQEQAAGEKSQPFEKPIYRNVRGERVLVASEWEAEEAERIMMKIEEVYDIEVGTFRDAEEAEEAMEEDSEKVAAKGIFGRRRSYGGNGGSGPVPWEYKELAAIERACDRYASILGDARKKSSRAGTDQEVDTIIKRNASGNALADYTYGPDRIRFFRSNTDADFNFDTNAQQLEGTAIHELAHGLCQYKLTDYVAELDYWRDQSRSTGRGESPITGYGGTSPGEDLSEAMMYYFIEPEKLKSECPKRFKFIQEMVESWTKENKKTDSSDS